MDKGEWLRSGFRLHPAVNGSFVLYKGNVEAGTMGKTVAFSNVDDLIDFLRGERDGLRAFDPEPSTAEIYEKYNRTPA